MILSKREMKGIRQWLEKSENAEYYCPFKGAAVVYCHRLGKTCKTLAISTAMKQRV